MGHQCIANLNDEIEALKKWMKDVAQGEKCMKSVKTYKILIYKICLTDSKALYEMIEVFFEDFVTECHQKIVSENENIEKCLEILNSYNTVAKQFGDIFAYLDKNYLENLRLKKSNWHQEDVAPENKKLSIFGMAMKMWTKTKLFCKKSNPIRPLENVSSTLAPIILVNYCDQVLKTAAKELIDQDALEEEMDVACDLYQYFDDKALFNENYGNKLAERIFSSLPISVEAEKLMMEKLDDALEEEMDVACDLYQYFDDKALFNENYGNKLAERIFSSLPISVEAEKLMMEKLDNLDSHLKKGYLQHLRNFSQKSLIYMNTLEAQRHVKMCLHLLKKVESSTKLIMPTSYDEILGVTSQAFVVDHLDCITSHCRTMFDSHNEDALSNVFQLLHFSGEAIPLMQRTYEDFIKKRSEDILTNFEENNVKHFIDSLADFHRKQTKLIKQIFSPVCSFIACFDKVFKNAINKNSQVCDSSNQKSTKKNYTLPELLVKHFEHLLNDDSKELDESALDEKLTGVVTIFKYIDDKDVFNKLYSKALAMRLLQSSKLFMEAEEMMINKLKLECGYQFVRPLEKMVTDYHLSKELTSKFNNSITLPISFNIALMQTGSWPIQACKLSPVIPQELSLVMTEFNKFYCTSHSGRKLHWHHVLSSCDIKLNYLSKTCIVHTSVVMTTILTIFNNVESATFNEIKSSTEIDSKDLLKHLQFLSTHKILLSGDGINTEVTEKSTFSLNYKYVSKRTNIRLMPVLREAKQEAKEITSTVLSERKYFLQALIVRIMKAKKKSTHSDLVNEVIQESMSNFVPTRLFIKNVIDCLIEKEYLARVEGTTDTYSYLA